MESEDHLMNRRRRYLEVTLEICLRGRATMDGGIGMNEGQILALLFRKAGV